MRHDERKHPRYTKAAAPRDEWAAEREAARERLLQQIESAFRDVRLGGGVSLHQARAMDDCMGETAIAAARELDTEERWQDISDEKHDDLSDTLAFMDAEGFRFHIPRFMVLALRNADPGSWAHDTAIYWSDVRDQSAQYLALLSDEQHEAIRAFAAFFADEA